MTEPATPLTDPRWASLSNSRREQLLEEYRDIEVEHFDWWDHVEGCFKEDMLEVQGITVHETYFSGFWSQGDGACFNGRVEDWDKVLDRLGYPQWKKWVREYTWTFSAKHEGHYCHEHSMRFDYTMDAPTNPFDEDEEMLRHDAWCIANDPPTESQLDKFCKELEDHFRDLASKYYRDLEAEYDYLTSDEHVVQYLLDNQEEELVETEEDEVATADF